jgi:hypothetical protein
MKLITTILLLLAAVLPVQANPAADQLADRIMEASGASNWPKVERVQFTFRVVVDGQEKMAAQHDWDVVANTDRVTWSGKTVTVDLSNPGEGADEKAAFKRWTNDAYWLLAPLKLKDPGTKLTLLGEGLLEISFNQVGLTPSDRYIYEIDPETNLPKSWTFLPNPETRNVASWEKYVTMGGLTLSTYHKMNNAEIVIDDLKVVAKP